MMQLKIKIGGPREAHGVSSLAEYEARARHFLLRSGLRLSDRKRKIKAFVSDSRWVVSCECNNGASASTEWKIAICFECGAYHRAVIFPRPLKEIEQALLARPIVNRHFFPEKERLEDLLVENGRMGVSYGLDRS